mgnify:CR=1 FL=1
MLFKKLDLDTLEVLEAAGTKWNFLPFKPGLVGGHCIGIDPYYLTYKAKQLGYKSKIINSGRKLNNSLTSHIFDNINNYFKKYNKNNKKNILIMGVTFKENCSDIRNSKVFDLYEKMYKIYNIHLYDPYASKEEVYNTYRIQLNSFSDLKKKYYDGIIICVSHTEFLNIELNSLIINKDALIYDLKSLYNNKQYMRL